MVERSSCSFVSFVSCGEEYRQDTKSTKTHEEGERLAPLPLTIANSDGRYQIVTRSAGAR